MKNHPFNLTIIYLICQEKLYIKKNLTARQQKEGFLPLLHQETQKTRNLAYVERTGIMSLSHDI